MVGLELKLIITNEIVRTKTRTKTRNQELDNINWNLFMKCHLRHILLKIIILKILLNPKILKTKVCKRTHLYVNGSSTYVIDLTVMISKRISLLIGLMMDHTLNFYAEINDNGVKVERCYPGAMGDNVYKLCRLHSAHPSNNVCRL